MAGPWKISKEIPLAVLVVFLIQIGTAFYWAGIWQSQLQHTIERIALHETVLAHGVVSETLADHSARLAQHEQWQQLGERFTKEDGHILRQVISDLREEIQLIKKY